MAAKVLHNNIARLTPGLAAAAFHGIIRTAYAVDSGEDDDLADAVASWILATSSRSRARAGATIEGKKPRSFPRHPERPVEGPGRVVGVRNDVQLAFHTPGSLDSTLGMRV